MRRSLKTALWMMAAAVIMPASAFANTAPKCEIVVASEVIDADGGSMTVASYRPAAQFLTGVYDAKSALVLDDEGDAIRGLICVRNDLVPTEKDYHILATGVPLSLSQDFDSADSDILTVYFSGGEFAHKYTSDYPMSDEFAEAVTARLTDFSSRNHGLIKPKK